MLCLLSMYHPWQKFVLRQDILVQNFAKNFLYGVFLDDVFCFPGVLRIEMCIAVVFITSYVVKG